MCYLLLLLLCDYQYYYRISLYVRTTHVILHFNVLSGKIHKAAQRVASYTGLRRKCEIGRLNGL